MKGRSIRNLSFLILIITAIYLLSLGWNNGIAYILSVILGSTLGVFGIAAIYEGFKGWLIFDIGIAFLLYPLSKIFGYNLNYISHIKEVLLGGSFLIAMQLFFDDWIRNKDAKRRCTVPFEAKCVSFTQAGVSTYVPIYRYHIDGKTNMFYGKNLYSVNPKLGDIITVFVNKKNENDIYCPTAKAILMIRYIFGFLILSFSTGAVVIL